MPNALIPASVWNETAQRLRTCAKGTAMWTLLDACTRAAAACEQLAALAEVFEAGGAEESDWHGHPIIVASEENAAHLDSLVLDLLRGPTP